MTLVEPEVAAEASAADVDPAVVAETIGNVGELKRRSKVRAFVPLPGVPAGARGIVTLVNGFGPWIRYRVLFDNGADIGQIDRELLVPAKRYDEMVERRRRAIESGAFAQAAPGEVAEEAGDAGVATAGGAVVNGVSVPQHLIDRSVAARQRLGG
jgi:hypothetical protein